MVENDPMPEPADDADEFPENSDSDPDPIRLRSWSEKRGRRSTPDGWMWLALCLMAAPLGWMIFGAAAMLDSGHEMASVETDEPDMDLRGVPLGAVLSLAAAAAGLALAVVGVRRKGFDHRIYFRNAAALNLPAMLILFPFGLAFGGVACAYFVYRMVTSEDVR